MSFPQQWSPLTVSTVALLGLSCSATPHVARMHPQTSWGGRLTGASSQLHQSCGAACAAPVNASTGEFLAPTATKFPCLSAHKPDPRTSPGVDAQLAAYQKLTTRCPAALISPAGLFQFGIL